MKQNQYVSYNPYLTNFLLIMNNLAPIVLTQGVSSYSGTHHHGNVLLLWPGGFQRLRCLLQPTVRPHHLLRVEFLGEHSDELRRLCESPERSPAGNQGPVQYDQWLSHQTG